MEKFKEKVRTRINSLSLLLTGTGLIYLVLMLNRDRLPVLPDFIQGFHMGIFISLELAFVFFVSKYLKAVKSDTELKKLYIVENDERKGLIIQKAGSLGLGVIFCGLGIATVIAGFFNTLVFFTLLGALAFGLVVFYSMWIYFSKKL